jgi:hypothetical protein
MSTHRNGECHRQRPEPAPYRRHPWLQTDWQARIWRSSLKRHHWSGQPGDCVETDGYSSFSEYSSDDFVCTSPTPPLGWAFKYPKPLPSLSLWTCQTRTWRTASSWTGSGLDGITTPLLRPPPQPRWVPHAPWPALSHTVTPPRQSFRPRITVTTSLSLWQQSLPVSIVQPATRVWETRRERTVTEGDEAATASKSVKWGRLRGSKCVRVRGRERAWDSKTDRVSTTDSVSERVRVSERAWASDRDPGKVSTPGYTQQIAPLQDHCKSM